MKCCAVVVALACASGCYTMRADIPGTWRPTAPNEDVVIVGHVDETTTHWFFLDGLLPSPPSTIYAEPLRAAVEKAGGDGVANLILDTDFTASDVAFRVFTIGIVTPRTYRVRADVVLLGVPPLPGKPLLRRRRSGDAAPAPAAPAPVVPAPPLPPVAPAAPLAPAAPVDPSEPPPLLGPGAP